MLAEPSYCCHHWWHSVSNPFRTGRYCAEQAGQVYIKLPAGFQTPSERGGIVLTEIVIVYDGGIGGFKPLQNGAVLCW